MGTYLTSKLNKFSLKYPNFDYDLDREVTLQRVALQIIKLQNYSGLDLDDFAKEIGIKSSNLSRLQSGEHNPTIVTLFELANKLGYEMRIEMKEK